MRKTLFKELVIIFISGGRGRGGWGGHFVFRGYGGLIEYKGDDLGKLMAN